MTRYSREEAARKADRELVLAEQGMARTVIAERLGISPSHVNGMIQRAKQRRERVKAGEVDA